MKRILLIIPYGGVGGMERLALSFYEYYKNLGYYIKVVKFIKLQDDIINFNKDEFYFSNRDYGAMQRYKRLLFNFVAPLKLRKIIVKNKITHSISFGEPANVFTSLTFTKEFKIGSIHALKSVELSNNSRLSRLTRFGFKYTYKKLDKLVCISHGIKKDLINNCDYRYLQNLEVIYNPHNIDRIRILSSKSIDDKYEASLFDNNTIVFLGRLSTQKSPWHLINSFYLAKKKNNKAKLVFIGDGDKNVLNYLKGNIKSLDLEESVFFLGRKSNPYKYLVKSKMLVLSSHYEGTPNVIVEAISLNIPVVSSNCTEGIVELMSLKESKFSNMENTVVEGGIITPNLYKGVLGIPKENNFIEEEEMMAKAINQIFESNNFSEEIKRKNKQLLSKFNLKNIANEYIKVK